MFNVVVKVKRAVHVKAENELLIVTKICSSQYTRLKRYSTAKPIAKMDSAVNEMLENNELKHRHHPGISRPNELKYPEWLVKATRRILSEQTSPKAELYEQAVKLKNHLFARHIPLEGERLNIQLEKIRQRLEKKQIEFEFENPEDLRKNNKIKRIAQEFLYNWSAMNYNRHNSILYLIARSVPDYVVLCKVFGEIYNRDKEFVPQSLFDFGSGVGTVLWAASNYWSESLKEHYCIDASVAMNDLSAEILTMADIKVQGVFHRQFLPAGAPTFDIVVSAYTLLELPNMQSRLDTILKLWMKTERYLIIVESGSNACFQVINEARDFITSFSRRRKKHPELIGHVFAPCPHDMKCPTFHERTIPCNFEVTYLSMPLPHVSAHKKERYCYAIFKKGPRPDKEDWPRINQPVLRRSRHVRCRMCTPSGELKELVVTKSKHGRHMYHCAKRCDWGDRLPIHFEAEE